MRAMGRRFSSGMQPGGNICRQRPNIRLEPHFHQKENDDQKSVDNHQGFSVPCPGGSPKRWELKVHATFATRFGLSLFSAWQEGTFHPTTSLQPQGLETINFLISRLIPHLRFVGRWWDHNVFATLSKFEWYEETEEWDLSAKLFGPSGQRAIGVRMDLAKRPATPRRHSGSCQRNDKLALTSRSIFESPRQLHAMRRIVDHRIPKGFHHH